MPLNTDLNVAPFFDDYDVNNQYYRILFRPGTALQARELTQMQTMLQSQIESFGGWAFRNGDIVSGCSISDDPNIPYVRLNDGSYDITSFVNTQIISTTSNLTARVILSKVGIGTSYPDTNILYIKYLNTGTAGQSVFSANETLNVYGIPSNGTPIATVTSFTNTAGQVSTGNAHGISVSEGVVFVNGVFVKVLNPTYGIVNAYGQAAGNTAVGFDLIESIITENQDGSLHDNALGYPNENAPGAWRLKLQPTLVALDPTAVANTPNFNPIARYNFGTLVSKSVTSSNLYSIVGNAIAQRIYEESGNYVVNPFVVDTVSTIPSVTTTNATSVLGRVAPGVGYAEGQRVELLKTAYINLRRGVDTQVYKSQQITFNYGSYYVLNEVSGIFPFDTAYSIDLYNAYQTSITSRTYGLTSPGGTKIGNAQIRCMSFVSGNPGSNSATYNLHVFNIQLANGYNTNQVKSIYYNGSVKGIADVSMVVPGLQKASEKDQLYTFGAPGLKNLRDAANNNNSQYIYRDSANGTILANGYISITLGSSAVGGVDILPYGNTGTSPLNLIDSASFIVIATANNQSNTLPGTVAVTTTSNAVVGTSTFFPNNFHIGNLLKVGTEVRVVTSVNSNTSLSIDAPFTVANASASYYEAIIAGKVIAHSETITGNNGIFITNSTNFSVRTDLSLATSSGVMVIYDVLRTSAIPASKQINKDRWVKIQANTNVNPTGPYSLGVSDLHQVKKIYGSADGSYTTSGVDLTSLFNFDTGQKDTYYGPASIYPSSGYNPTTYPYLLVQCDYFTTNTASGMGFFTVESYPIDDANTANTNGILTKDIPLYVDEGGNKRWLRDYIDFRIPSTPVANNTGVCNTANATSVTTAISYATVNPANTLNLIVPSGGLNTPSYGRNFQGDFTTYLPRKDLVMITPDNTLKIKEGLSTSSPQTPLYPENAMVLAVVNIPPFPSLATDEVDSDRLINQNSTSLSRDTSTAIGVTLVGNRRYTMKDIGKLDNRITNIEYYTSLSLLEQKAKATSVTDANGLDRFKNGIFVDAFNDYQNSDVSNPEYGIAIDRSKTWARPRFIQEVISLKFNTGTSVNIQQTNRVLTLPYTTTALISQPYATKYRSSAHVASAWNGSLTLMPSYSNHVDTNNTASFAINIDNAQAWKDFANTPYASNWGAWQTTSNVTSNTVITGKVDTYNFEGGYGADLSAIIRQFSSQGYQIGATTSTWYQNPLYPPGLTKA